MRNERITSYNALSGTSFGMAYGAYGLAGAVDIPVQKGGKMNVNVGGGISTPGVTYFDFSNSRLIGNTKDTVPYAIGLSRAFGYL